jgi:hypothetical protein
VSAFARAGAYRLSVSGSVNNSVKNIIIADNKIYIWYDSGKSYYTGNIGNDTAIHDQYEMIPTYEDILRLSKADILEADFKKHNNEPCIFVRAQYGDLEYFYEYYVSVNTGLLTAALKYDKTELIYSMSADSVVYSVPSADMFKLPDGKSVISS